MKPRKPLPRPTKPLARSTKPLKRTPLSRKPGRAAKAKKAAIEAAKDYYFSGFGMDEKKTGCQLCSLTMWRDDCAGHHKIKRSLWATASVEERQAIGDVDSKKNLVIIHHRCHDKLHLETPESIAELNCVRASEANALNGKFIK